MKELNPAEQAMQKAVKQRFDGSKALAAQQGQQGEKE